MWCDKAWGTLKGIMYRKGLIRPYKGLIRPLKGLIRPFLYIMPFKVPQALSHHT